MSSEFSRLVKILEQLRGERGCPWDKEQTRDSLKPFLVEEVYEVLEAMEQPDPVKIKEELGDLFLQIVFHCQIAKERKEFDAEAVLTACIEKLIRRHPHVFGNENEMMTAQEVLQRWEDLKREERGPNEETSLLDGLPKTLPALLQAYRVQERVSRVGFDWPADEVGDKAGITNVLAKVQEELNELEDAIQHNQKDQARQELGDLLFSLVNLARFMRVDPEGTLRETTARFMRRFKEINRLAKQQGKSLEQLSLDEMDLLWEQVKQNESSPQSPNASSQ
ncbi:MAG: nucleoside triphosphate pyrophosphohydrolase [Nitrospira sp.]|nr:nucleoside triphosphate pyrophosphohydrolase [Nitrospira sp.]